MSHDASERNALPEALDVICESFEKQWADGQRPPIEEYISKVPDYERRSLLKELLSIELWWRQRQGEKPLRDEYAVWSKQYIGVVDNAFQSATPPKTASRMRSDESTLLSQSMAKPGPGVLGPNAEFGDYWLLEEIARGGMGVVYKARQKSLNRVVALKMILSGQLAGDDEVRRFHNEAKAAANLDHPNIVPIHEVGEHNGQHYFSMGYVVGESLADQVAEGPLPPREAAELLRILAEAVAYAHENGVIHRDLKPANVLIDSSGQPRVTDFGLAKQIEGDSSLTGTGQILGTPSYMPPEQASGRQDQVGPHSDIYALGAVLYCLLTGHPPFQADNTLDTLMQVLEKEPVSPRVLNSTVPKDLETICLKCLNKNSAKRYRAARKLASDAGCFLAGRAITARPIGSAQRLWRWAKRNRTLALSMTIFVPIVFVSIGMGIGFGLAMPYVVDRMAYRALLTSQDIMIERMESFEEVSVRSGDKGVVAYAYYGGDVDFWIDVTNGDSGDPVTINLADPFSGDYRPASEDELVYGYFIWTRSEPNDRGEESWRLLVYRSIKSGGSSWTPATSEHDVIISCREGNSFARTTAVTVFSDPIESPTGNADASGEMSTSSLTIPSQVDSEFLLLFRGEENSRFQDRAEIRLMCRRSVPTE